MDDVAVVPGDNQVQCMVIHVSGLLDMLLQVEDVDKLHELFAVWVTVRFNMKIKVASYYQMPWFIVDFFQKAAEFREE